jgi:hypothetical protein
VDVFTVVGVLLSILVANRVILKLYVIMRGGKTAYNMSAVVLERYSKRLTNFVQNQAGKGG